MNIYWLLIRVSQSKLSDKSIHADSMGHLQMFHLNGNNDDKEKGERDAISSFHLKHLSSSTGPHYEAY